MFRAEIRRPGRTRVHLVALIVATLALAASVQGAGSGSGTPAPTSKKEKIAWDTSFKSALKQAAKEEKLVMAYFYPTHFVCPPCEMLKSTTFPDASVVKLSTKFVGVKIDATNNMKLARQYMVGGYPSIKFINADGHLVHTSEGYAPPQRFVAQMSEAVRLEAKFSKLVDDSKKNPDDAKLHVELGEQLQERTAFDEAEVHFTQAEKLDPDDKLKLHSRIRLNQARLALQQNKPEKARKLLGPVIKAGGDQASFAAYMHAVSFIVEAQQLDASATGKSDAAKVAKLQKDGIVAMKGVAKKYSTSDWGRRAAAIVEQLEGHAGHDHSGHDHSSHDDDEGGGSGHE